MRYSRLVVPIFVLSGAAGLMYEIVWARQLVLVFGNTTQAVSTILTGYFGGMAVGSFLGGRLADRVRSPLRLYGVIEVVLVLVVLATPITFRLLHELYRDAYPALEATPIAVALLRFVLAVLALAPATILMGATLPALTRQLSRDAHLSRAFGRLYAANTIGAIIGTVAAGLVLIELLGLTGTLVTAASCSGIAGLVAIWLSRGNLADTPPTRTHTASEAPIDAPGNAYSRPRLALALAFVSGLTSLGYQVLWTRLLSSGTGNSTYVFTIILATFLIGIALGATFFSTIRTRIGDPVKLLATAQVLVATLAILGLVLVIGRPGPLDPSQPLASAWAIFGPVLFVVLPATFVMGLSFPAASALLGDAPSRIGTSSGTLLAVNTFGAIIATFAIPFAVIPVIGSPEAVAVLAIVNALTAVGIVLGSSGIGAVRRAVTTVAGGAVAVAIVVSLVVPGVIVDPAETRIRNGGGTIFASAEDEIASVQAGRRNLHELWVTGTSMTLLTVDAKLMPILPLMLRPDSESALTVAFGMGSTYRAALIADLRTDGVELVPSVPTMFGWFYDDAAAVLADPDGRLIIADGRNHIELTDETYDIIVTDPPPPIESSGASVISSLEYYQAGRARLNPGGVMMQWTPYGGSVDEFRAHLRTFHAVFPHVLIAFGPGGYGFFLFGSGEPLAFEDAAIRDVLARPGVLEEISSAYDSPESTVEGWIERIRSLVWIADEEVAQFTGDGPLITDDRPLPEYFLLRRLFGTPSPRVTPTELFRLTGR
ncbi:MAG TPA: fused MFS/spermidine synthase [Candidatus Limnocylindrales bacterium]|nr:fused MFS/spermidine synthase [Candidatus Limnocylindrales bacterium]